MGGLVLRPTSTSTESAEFAVELDSAEPYLDDHRPGGHPLFGTVMGLELMARSVDRMAGHLSPPTHVAQVIVRDPIIVTAASTTAYVQVTRSIADRRETFACDVVTRDGTVKTHSSATLECAQPISHTVTMNIPNVDSPLPVRAIDIYELFFHGPAFRVIQRAALVHDEVIAEIATGLPALTTDPHDTSVLAPRLIEACLQTAGLLEIATRSRMMIPSRIDIIAFCGDHTSIPDRLFTRARRSMTTHHTNAVDIDVVDLDGACWLKVGGYETLPLPYPSDSAAIVDLNKAFHRET